MSTITFLPVSYTHLDVYKRQAQRSLLLDGAFREPFGNGKIRGLMQFHADTRWTPETANTATTPRFTETNAVYNMRSSCLLYTSKRTSYPGFLLLQTAV